MKFLTNDMLNQFQRKSGKILLLCIILLYPAFLFSQVALKFNDKDELIQVINTHLNKGELEKGRELLDANSSSYPYDADIKMLMGKYHVLKKQYDKARFELNKALEFNNKNVDVKNLLITVETETKRYSSAICYVNELLEVNPYWKVLWRKKIELYRLLGNSVEANRLLKRLAQIFPNDVEIKEDISYQMEEQILHLKKEGKIDESNELNELLIKDKPNQIAYYLELINNYIKVGNYDEALSTTERGLNRFPNHYNLIEKKIAILDHHKQYDEILLILQGPNKTRFPNLYSYYLTEAARAAKDQDPAVLYGKILTQNPANEEAFHIVLNDEIANQQYDQALNTLSSYINLNGTNKELALKELAIYRLKGDEKKVKQLSNNLYLSYPEDDDLKYLYANNLQEDIKDLLTSQNYFEVIPKLLTLQELGDQDQQVFAQNGLFTAYNLSGNYNNAYLVLEQLMNNDPENLNLKIKSIQLKKSLGQIDLAMEEYESLLKFNSNDDQYDQYLNGYDELMAFAVKNSNESSDYPLALSHAERWLTAHPQNKDALMYAINLSYQLKLLDKMLQHSTAAIELYPNDVNFKLKHSTASSLQGTSKASIYEELKAAVASTPYHEKVVESFVEHSLHYAEEQYKLKQENAVLDITALALKFKPDHKDLNYLRGLAFEKLKQFDSAYFYQKFYTPSIIEEKDFIKHLEYLNLRHQPNDVGISQLRSRLGDEHSIQSISSLEYNRLNGDNTYTARLHYTGRADGRGIMGQVEWQHLWNEDWSSKFDLALANQYFNRLNLQGTIFRNLKNDWQLEAGIGYRELFTSEKMSNATIGIAKELNQFRLNSKLTLFNMEGKLLYNTTIQGRYSFSIPKNYILGIAGIGSSPDVEMLNYQFINGFSVQNALFGAGFGHMIYKNVSTSIIGTWYHFNSNQNQSEYNSLYNLHMQLNVSF